MSPVLPFDIIAQIIDIVGDNKDTDLLKELALVSYSFHLICIKHLFATVVLHQNAPNYYVASSKNGFVKLLTSRPDVVKYIRKLTYNVGYDELQPNVNDQLLLPVLSSNFLPTISRLNCLSLSHLNWNTLKSLTSAFLHLMHLPTINHIDLSFIRNFPLSSLTPCVNLLRLDIFYVGCANPEEDGCPEVVQSALMPKIREFHASRSCLLTTKLLHAEMQDGQPAFNFTYLRRLWITFTNFEDEPNIRFLLQNAKLLEELHLSVKFCRRFKLHDILSPSARTLKVLDLTVPIYDPSTSLQLAGLCEELESIAGHNTLEALSLEVEVEGDESEVYVGSKIQNVEKVLVKPGWSALRQVSFKVSITRHWVTSTNFEALQSLPDKYLSHLSKLESVAFNFSIKIV
jgi:hypothetical protein